MLDRERKRGYTEGVLQGNSELPSPGDGSILRGVNPRCAVRCHGKAVRGFLRMLARLLEIYMDEMPNYVREAKEHPVIALEAEADPVKTDINVYLLGEVPPTRVSIDLFGD